MKALRRRWKKPDYKVLSLYEADLEDDERITYCTLSNKRQHNAISTTYTERLTKAKTAAAMVKPDITLHQRISRRSFN